MASNVVSQIQYAPASFSPSPPDSLTNDLVNGSSLAALLGTFWSYLYGDKDFVEDFLSGRAQSELQTFNDLDECAESVSRLTVPTYHREYWRLFVLNKSTTQTGHVTLFASTGKPATFGPQAGTGQIYYFGRPAGYGAAHPTFDDSATDAPLMLDSMTEPAVVLVEGVDYVLDLPNGLVKFVQSPFDNPLLTQEPVHAADGTIVDYQIGLWVYAGSYDKSTAWQQYGYVLNLFGTSSDNYTAALNAAFDSLVGGTARQQIEQLFAALAGTPVVRNPVETVQVVQRDANHLLVITDLEVYKFPLSATALVAPGQQVRAGNQLVDTVTILEFTGGTVPPSLSSVTLGPSTLLFGAYQGTLTFLNTPVSTVVTLNVGGKTKIEWPLQAQFAADNTAFWTNCHNAGLVAGKTLANLLDTRPNPVGEPTAANLPATMNPLGFLASNVLRYNSFVVQVKTAQFGPNALGVDGQDALYRKVVPPEKLMLLQKV